MRLSTSFTWLDLTWFLTKIRNAMTVVVSSERHLCRSACLKAASWGRCCTCCTPRNCSMSSLGINYGCTCTRMTVKCTTPADDATATLAHLSAAITDINDWMKASRLCLNPSKTQVIWLGTKQQLDKIVIKDVPLLSTVVTVVDSVCDLGIIIDSQLSMDALVAAFCRSGYYQLRQLRPVTRSLSTAVAETAFVVNRLDYCNSLLYGVADGLMRHLQSVQNAAARLVTGVRHCDHITPTLQQLHWLPVR